MIRNLEHSHTGCLVCGFAHSVVPARPGTEPWPPAVIARLGCQPVAKLYPNKIHSNLENSPIT